MAITLYVLTASHPCIAVELMLRRKGLEYRRVELPLLLSRGILRAMRFTRRTVPALRVGDRRVQGSRERGAHPRARGHRGLTARCSRGRRMSSAAPELASKIRGEPAISRRA